MTLLQRSIHKWIPVLAMCLVLVPAVAMAAGSINPLTIQGPVASSFAVKAVNQVPVMDTGKVDIYALRSELNVGEAPQFADPQAAFITPETHGAWERLDDRFEIWQLRVSARGALSLNFGFDKFDLPKGARLTVYPADLTDPEDMRKRVQQHRELGFLGHSVKIGSSEAEVALCSIVN